ncbi:MAG: 1-deoxy-D-xylulose-5-phosphate reductoisomerase [Puniceicoccales bacterium]|jgi:1-deoxy-D-xylulose-5-phosphate reductoisomerase|nr:1-deoxy-D-xylulose-5-phosphate reductoisomerase [Puniceicoccales bacterium]
MKSKVILLGATGSIGSSVLEELREHRQHFELVGIAAKTNLNRLAEISGEFSVKNLAISDGESEKLHELCADCRVFSGEQAMDELVSNIDFDIFIMAVSGLAGLRATLNAISLKKKILIASKEILVTAGKFLCAQAKKNNVELLPIDSEHNAIFQCLAGEDKKSLRQVWLTASGGPFLDYDTDALDYVTPQQALKHPTWRMGQKITIDSATLANKGLEMIEARWLFDLAPQQIKVTIHRQSLVHSLVEFLDGSIIAQISEKSMRFPIRNCLFYPHRQPSSQKTVSFSDPINFSFEPPDEKKFPCLRLAKLCLEAGGIMPTVFNAANDTAVELFLEDKIKFTRIPTLIEQLMNGTENFEPESIDEIITCHMAIKKIAQNLA